MYHFFVGEGQIADDCVRIEGPDVNHIGRVLRMRPGEIILVSDASGCDYRCALRKIGRESVTAEILERLSGSRELSSRLVLFQGLPKGDKLEWIVQKATELGAAQIVPVAMKRSVVKLDAKKAKSRQLRLQAVAESAAKQAKRSRIPQVAPVMSWKEALEAAGELDRLLVPYEAANGMERTRKILQEIRPGESIGIVIGPEGGFAPEEAAEAADAGGELIALGSRILRTETAGLALLAALMLQLDGREAE